MALYAVSLCSGIGGIDRALAPIARTVCYVEREAFAVAVLVSQMQRGELDSAPVWSNLETFPSNLFDPVHLVHAGFPCQPFSYAGRREGTHDRRWIWPEISRVVHELGPSYVFLENVPGLVSMGLGTALGDLAAMGYDAEWGVLSACAVGAPHTRDRLFILAYSYSNACRQGVGQDFHIQTEPYDWQCPERYLDIRKDTQSRADGVANGTEDWVDRLYVIGNSVVPLQVQTAWNLLWARMFA